MCRAPPPEVAFLTPTLSADSGDSSPKAADSSDLNKLTGETEDGQHDLSAVDTPLMAKRCTWDERQGSSSAGGRKPTNGWAVKMGAAVSEGPKRCRNVKF